MNCLIRIRGKATTDTTDQTELMVRGLCRPVNTADGPGYRFDYRSADSEDPNSVTKEQLTVTAARASLIRTGSIRSEMEIVPGEIHPCDYDTAFGMLTFDVVGLAVSVSEDAGTVTACFSYELRHGDEVLSRNDIEITAEPA
ncbi:MAG: DUF1934 domain-containing protein [Lachnospiraceae bacterium]|nr:DUF1934 domain-containing protein [Lachnospiraceae bacterium]